MSGSTEPHGRSRSGSATGALGSSALTPLLDTLFLLLFTLLATSRSATLVEHDLREEIAVELPSVDDAGGSSTAGNELLRVLVIGVSSAGEVELLELGNGPERSSRSVAAADLPAALRRVLGEGQGSSARAEIRADENAAHGVVLDVLQALRAAGVSDVSFIATLNAGEGL